jgi:hypothetical protein
MLNFYIASDAKKNYKFSVSLSVGKLDRSLVVRIMLESMDEMC